MNLITVTPGQTFTRKGATLTATRVEKFPANAMESAWMHVHTTAGITLNGYQNEPIDTATVW